MRRLACFWALRYLSNGYHRRCYGQLANKVLPILHFHVASVLKCSCFLICCSFVENVIFFLPEISSAFIQLVIIKQLLRNLDNGSV